MPVRHLIYFPCDMRKENPDFFAEGTTDTFVGNGQWNRPSNHFSSCICRICPTERVSTASSQPSTSSLVKVSAVLIHHCQSGSTFPFRSDHPLSPTGDVLNIDPLKFYSHLYKTLLTLHAGNLAFTSVPASVVRCLTKARKADRCLYFLSVCVCVCI